MIMNTSDTLYHENTASHTFIETNCRAYSTCWLILQLFLRYQRSLSIVSAKEENLTKSQIETLKENLNREFSTLKDFDLETFYSLKEKEYQERQKRITEFCNTKGKDFGKRILEQTKQNLLFDDKDKVAYCKIAKVATSTWCNHFIKLGIYQIQMTEVIIANIIFSS